MATGLYYQRPLYRECVRLNGTRNPDIREQRRLQVVLGMTETSPSGSALQALHEMYYKGLDDLIPYQLEKSASGTWAQTTQEAMPGIDTKLSGEFMRASRAGVPPS